MSERLLILGASARAAAASARRAGFEPFAIDLFADADTKRICDCLKCPPEDYPNGLFRLARLASPMPWMYTGGLENYPELIGELSAERELWGNGPEVLRKVRDPFALSELLSAKGLSHPQSLKPGNPPADGSQWLRKPVRGSAGHGIRFAEPVDFTAAGRGHYLQAYIPGPPTSAVCVGRRLVGYTLQLIGTAWLHAPSAFSYAGNIGPIAFTGDGTQDTVLTAFRLGDRASVCGMYGIDFVPVEDRAYVLEVNPRYPASAEVYEHARGLKLIGWHYQSVFQKWPLPDAPTVGPVVGKAIYYAPHQVTIPASGPWDDSLTHADDVWRRPDYADIPHAGDVIDRGHPVLTILAEAANEADCLAQLQSRAADLDRLFGVRP